MKVQFLILFFVISLLFSGCLFDYTTATDSVKVYNMSKETLSISYTYNSNIYSKRIPSDTICDMLIHNIEFRYITLQNADSIYIYSFPKSNHHNLIGYSFYWVLDSSMSIYELENNGEDTGFIKENYKKYAPKVYKPCLSYTIDTRKESL